MMNAPCIFFCVILIHITSLKCEIPSCKINCSTNEACWQDTLAYHSAEFIEQLFSFSSLAVHMEKFHQSHSSEVNDSIAFIDQILENTLSNELINTSLTMDLFNYTKQILIESCANLTSVPVEAVDKLPPLVCSLSTCDSDTMNFLVILIVSIVLTSVVALLCFGQSIQIYRQVKDQMFHSRSISFSAHSSAVNFDSNRF